MSGGSPAGSGQPWIVRGASPGSPHTSALRSPTARPGLCALPGAPLGSAQARALLLCTLRGAGAFTILCRVQECGLEPKAAIWSSASAEFVRVRAQKRPRVQMAAPARPGLSAGAGALRAGPGLIPLRGSASSKCCPSVVLTGEPGVRELCLLARNNSCAFPPS